MNRPLLIAMLTLLPLLGGIVSPALAQDRIEEELDGAKELYREGRLEDAIVALQSVITLLDAERDHPGRIAELADAHFHLGLAYLALRDEPTALENFRRVVALAPDYRLDPDVYAPRVIAAFETARAAVPAVAAAGESGAVRGSGDLPESPAPVTTAEAGPATARLQPGTRLRVEMTTRPRPIEGRLLGLDPEMLAIGADDWSLDVSRDTLIRVEASAGTRNHWMAGALIGTGFGALIGALETPGCEGNDGDCYTRGENIAYGSIGFGLVGALVGALYRTQEWVEVPVDSLPVSVRVRDSGVLVSLTWP